MSGLYCGDVVRLMFGTTKMTINRIDPLEEIVECVWFDFHNRLCRESFNPAILVKVEN
jgi:uncharacterized protein YodC (DUF2158 family)